MHINVSWCRSQNIASGVIAKSHIVAIYTTVHFSSNPTLSFSRVGSILPEGSPVKS